MGESLFTTVTNRVKKVTSDSFRTIAELTYKGYSEAPVPKLSNDVLQLQIRHCFAQYG